MYLLKIFTLLFFIIFFGCSEVSQPEQFERTCADYPSLNLFTDEEPFVRGALIATRFESLEELKSVIQIEYFSSGSEANQVRLIHCSNGKKVTSILKSGVSEKNFSAARNGGFLERLALVFKSPYAVIHRKDLQGIFFLARRVPYMFGENDPAFYDISMKTMANINKEDSLILRYKDLTSEKGYINTINHITAQVFVTSIFSERLADFVADAHERKNLPELITGKFTNEQIADLETGPVDNYVDVINNEWGQELGKLLKEKYNISRETYWTPDLLTCFLNDIQRYYGWAFQVGFRPFQHDDELVLNFSKKINLLLNTTAD